MEQQCISGQYFAQFKFIDDIDMYVGPYSSVDECEEYASARVRDRAPGTYKGTTMQLPENATVFPAE